MTINPFAICSVEAIRSFAPFVAFDTWQAQCLALGATREQIASYDATVRSYAPTTLYPNERVIAYTRKLAVDALLRGESWPKTAAQAIEQENQRLPDFLRR